MQFSDTELKLEGTRYFFDQYRSELPLKEKLFLIEAAVFFARSIIEIFGKDAKRTGFRKKDELIKDYWGRLFAKPLRDMRVRFTHVRPLKTEDLKVHSNPDVLANALRILKTEFDQERTMAITTYEDTEGTIKKKETGVSLGLKPGLKHEDYPSYLVNEAIYY